MSLLRLVRQLAAAPGPGVSWSRRIWYGYRYQILRDHGKHCWKAVSRSAVLVI